VESRQEHDEDSTESEQESEQVSAEEAAKSEQESAKESAGSEGEPLSSPVLPTSRILQARYEEQILPQ
jgi:hypothetical protein